MVKYDVDELKRQRMIKGISIAELAEGAGLVYETLSRLEEGVTRKPHANTMRKLARILGIELEILVTKSGGF